MPSQKIGLIGFALILSCCMTGMMTAVPLNVILNLIEKFGNNDKAIFIAQLGISISAFSSGFGSIFLSYYQKWHSKITLILGLIIFSFFGVMIQYTNSTNVFIIYRIIQGLGAAMIFAGSLHIMRHALHQDLHPKFFAFLSIAMSVNMIAIGVFNSAIRSQNIDQFKIFYYHLLCIIPAIIIYRIIPNHKQEISINSSNQQSKSPISKIQYAQFAIFSLAVFTLTMTYNTILMNGPIKMHNYNISDKYINLFTTIYPMTTVSMLYFALKLIKKFGYKICIIISISLALIGMHTISNSITIPYFLISIVFIGMSAGIGFVIFTPLGQSLLPKSYIRATTNMVTAMLYLGYGTASLFSYIIHQYYPNIDMLFKTNYAILFILALAICILLYYDKLKKIINKKLSNY